MLACSTNLVLEMPRFGSWLDCACLQYNFSTGNASFRLLAWVYAGICASICAGIQYTRVRVGMREYAAVCVGIHEYMREYAGVGASMRECTRVYASTSGYMREHALVCANICVGMRECMRDYAGVCASMHGYTRVHARECARVCVGMREYAAVCVGIREYMREYAYARVRAPALSDTVRKPCCLSGAVTWGKQQML